MRRLAEHARAAFEVPRDLLLGRYPEFVTGGALPRGHVPVFVFHTLEPQSFGRRLQYLADNGYVTLSAEEYFVALMNSRPAPERAVLLTLDDGRASVYSVGYPLLSRYGMKAVVFLVPSRITSAPARPAALGAAGQEPPDPNEGFLSWEEVEVLSGSGLFEFHSHSLTHARIHTGPHLVDFLTPPMREGYRSLDVPRIHEGGRDLPVERIPLGTPLLRSAPRLSEERRFYEDPAIRREAVERVAAEGGEGFFCKNGWRRTLRSLMAARPLRGRLETPRERESAIRHELTESKRLIEDRVGKPVTHLCYPWHVAGPSAERIAREAGYRTAFCGKLRGIPLTLPGGDPQRIARIGEDYLETLPGKRRVGIAEILRRKWRRRLGEK
jgi:peptidoglycan/xylan/chitin deacetylase (PgdA/CDA1 family)